MSDMNRIVSRREFVAALAASGLVTMGVARVAGAQNAAPQDSSSPAIPGATMEGDGYVAITRPPKPGARPSMSAEERDALERKLSCPCPCTLDVFTCRTSMPCGFSPRMHADVVRLVEGGYSGEEILAAFEQGYGEKVLMSPKKEGFNLVGYAAPFLAVGTGAVVLAALLRRWGRAAAARPARSAPAAVADATPDELARLERAVRGEEEAR